MTTKLSAPLLNDTLAAKIFDLQSMSGRGVKPLSFLTIRTNDQIFAQYPDAPDAKHYLFSQKNGHFYVDTASTKYGQVVARIGPLLFEASGWPAEVFNKFYPVMKSNIDGADDKDLVSYDYKGKTRMLASVPGIEAGQRYDLCQDDRLPDAHWLVVSIENTSTQSRAVYEVVRGVPFASPGGKDFGPEEFRQAAGSYIEPVPNTRLTINTGGEGPQKFIGIFLSKVEDFVWDSAKALEKSVNTSSPRP